MAETGPIPVDCVQADTFASYACDIPMVPAECTTEGCEAQRSVTIDRDGVTRIVTETGNSALTGCMRVSREGLLATDIRRITDGWDTPIED